jgi:hypothetical protein
MQSQEEAARASRSASIRHSPAKSPVGTPLPMWRWYRQCEAFDHGQADDRDRCTLAAQRLCALQARVGAQAADGGAQGRHHARRRGARHQQFIRDGEIADQPRRDRPAARLGATGPVEQQYAAATAGQVVRRSGAGGPVATVAEGARPRTC